MTREQMVLVNCKKAEAQGYEFIGKGNGSYDGALAEYRAKGYDVRCWYTAISKGAKTWIMYGKMKASKGKAPVEPAIQYETLTSKELREICKMNSVSQYYKLNKQQMIDSLKALA